ncbi:MAG: ABC transporter permease, partial [Mycobacteriales bacterium]
ADAAVLTGRVLVDAALMVVVAGVTFLVGLAVGFRPAGSTVEGLAMVGLVAIFALPFAWVFV